jgi:hypothetical protein
MKFKFLLFLWLVFSAFFLQGQRTNYYTYLGEKFNTLTSSNANPSIYPAKDGGVFLADSKIYGAVRLTKFDVYGNIVWQVTHSFLCDGMEFISLKETNKGNIVLLVEVSWARKFGDAVFFHLDKNGNEIFKSFVISSNPKFINSPNDFYLIGDTIFVFGKAYQLWDAKPYGFFSYSNIYTGETYKVKTFSHPTNAYFPGDLIHYNADEVLFTSVIGDTSAEAPTSSLGLLTYFPKTDSFYLRSVSQEAGKMVVRNEIKFNPEDDFKFGVTHKNQSDSTFILSFISHADFSTFILKFDCQGNLIKQKKILRSKEYGDQTIYQITSFLLDNVKLLIYQFGGDSIENSYYLADIDDNLNITEKSKFFSESIAYKNFVDQYSLSQYFTTSTKWLFEMPYLIYDRQGDLIFSALMFQNDSIFIGRIMLIKFKENGEVVTYNQVEMFNEEKFLVYPNPFKDYITINLPFDSSYLIEILDIHGKLIYQTSGSGYFNLNLSTLIPSTYNVRFTNQNHNQTHYQKIIKLP